ncbi:MAG: T9SS type A sorting domain-containing protein [Bacteroidota bacterium]
MKLLYTAAQAARKTYALFFLLFGTGLATHGQPPASWQSIPATFGDGDEIDLRADYGTISHQAIEVISVTMEWGSVGCTIAETSPLSTDVSNSWLATGTNWTATVSRSTDGKILTLTVSRTDNVPQSGYGEIALAKGVIIIVDEDFRRLAGKPYIRLLKSEVKRSAEDLFLSVYPNPARNFIQLDRWHEVQRLELQDVQGRIYPLPVSQRISVEHLPRGFYLLRVKTAEGRAVQKVVLQ